MLHGAMSRSGSEDKPDLAEAATVLSSVDGSLDETVQSVDFPRVDLTQATEGNETDDGPVVEKGTAIGRYVVLATLGSGTMGVVMSAIDPTLDRKVAIKLVVADRSGSTTGRQRLLREAQAMARLAHPNVVTVFEVGTFGERVFLAMEYIAGSTLGAWLAEARRSRRDIVNAFMAAGQGLAAAHRAGIVHRDFKPANVLVARDGRVRVADFGLATAPDARAVSAPMQAVNLGEMSMTSTGAIMGTPTYMSPEQHRGNQADARADQFSFCVALYEALYGELPFEGTAYLVYADNVLAGRIREAPRSSRVPSRIRKVLLRGLALAPEARYPKMEVLLEDLARDPSAMRLKIAAGVLGVAVVAGGAAVIARRDGAVEPPDPCAGAEQPLAALWNADARAVLQQAFATPGADAFTRTARLFDAQAAALRAARRDACLATAVRHEQSAELLDRRMSCIDQRAAELTSLYTVLSDHPDATAINKAVEAATSLPSVQQCADRAALLADVPLPTTSDARGKVVAIEQQLDRANALESAGKYVQALAVTAGLLPEIDRLDYAPLRARVHFTDAQLHEELGQHEQAVAALRVTGDLAAAAHDDKLLARTWTLLYATLGARLAKFDEAKAFEPQVATAVVRAGNPPELRGKLDSARGAIQIAAGNPAAAAPLFESAVRELSQALGPNHPRVASALGNVGTAYEESGRYDEARKAMDRALAIRVEVLGAEHADVSYSHYQLGSLLDTMEQPEKSLAEFEKSLAIDKKIYPEDSPHIATDYVSLGVVLVELDRMKEALDYQERAVAILEKNPVDNQTKMATALLDLANTYRGLKRNADATKTYERAIDFATKTVGADNIQIADIRNNMALLMLNMGDAKRAREMWRQALAIRKTKLGPDHPEVAKSIAPLAEEAFDRGAFAESVTLMSEAIAILEKRAAKLPLLFMMIDMRGRAHLALHHHAEAAADMTRARDGYLENKMAGEAATARISLAEALWGTKAHEAALVEARTALDELQALPKPDADALAKVRAWLKSHH